MDRFRFGHVPGSLNLPHTHAFQPDGSLTPSQASSVLASSIRASRVVVIVANKGESGPVVCYLVVSVCVLCILFTAVCSSTGSSQVPSCLCSTQWSWCIAIIGTTHLSWRRPLVKITVVRMRNHINL